MASTYLPCTTHHFPFYDFGSPVSESPILPHTRLPTWVHVVSSCPCHPQQGGERRCSRERPLERSQSWEGAGVGCEGGCPVQAAPWSWSWRLACGPRSWGSEWMIGLRVASPSFWTLWPSVGRGYPLSAHHDSDLATHGGKYPGGSANRVKPPALGREPGRPVGSSSVGSW